MNKYDRLNGWGLWESNVDSNIPKSRMHSSRMRTDHCSGRGGSPSRHSPWTETPMDRDTPPCEQNDLDTLLKTLDSLAVGNYGHMCLCGCRYGCSALCISGFIPVFIFWVSVWNACESMLYVCWVSEV